MFGGNLTPLDKEPIKSTTSTEAEIGHAVHVFGHALIEYLQTYRIIHTFIPGAYIPAHTCIPIHRIAIFCGDSNPSSGPIIGPQLGNLQIHRGRYIFSMATETGLQCTAIIFFWAAMDREPSKSMLESSAKLECSAIQSWDMKIICLFFFLFCWWPALPRPADGSTLVLLDDTHCNALPLLSADSNHARPLGRVRLKHGKLSLKSLQGQPCINHLGILGALTHPDSFSVKLS